MYIKFANLVLGLSKFIMNIYKKLLSALSLSGINFILSIIGVFISLKFIETTEWANLGLLLALLPLTSVFVFIMKHQSILVFYKGESVKYLMSTERHIIPVLKYTLPIVFFALYFSFQKNLELAFVGTMFSLVLAGRLVQKYALTLDSKPFELYVSNIMSLFIWICCFLIFLNFDKVDTFYRVLFNIIGEVFAYFYIKYSFKYEQESISSYLKVETSESNYLNLFRVLIRQTNYNLPVYLVNFFLSTSSASQIGQLSRVRVVIDQLTNAFVVSLSNKIMNGSFQHIIISGTIACIPAIFLFYLGTESLSYYNSIIFEIKLFLWFLIVVCFWITSTLLTLKLEGVNHIKSLIFLELIFSTLVVSSFVFIFI
jgi:hypothetical protein